MSLDERKFKDFSETAVWLLKEALTMFGKLNPKAGDPTKNGNYDISGQVFKSEVKGGKQVT